MIQNASAQTCFLEFSMLRIIYDSSMICNSNNGENPVRNIPYKLTIKTLNHWGWVMHICVSKLTIIGSDSGVSPGHYLKQCWNVANWTLRNKLQSSLVPNSYIFIQENTHDKSSGKWRKFCFSLNMLIIVMLNLRKYPSLWETRNYMSYIVKYCCW